MEGNSDAQHKGATKTENFEEEENAAEGGNKKYQQIYGAEKNIQMKTRQQNNEAAKKKVSHPTNIYEMFLLSIKI